MVVSCGCHEGSKDTKHLEKGKKAGGNDDCTPLKSFNIHSSETFGGLGGRGGGSNKKVHPPSSFFLKKSHGLKTAEPNYQLTIWWG